VTIENVSVQGPGAIGISLPVGAQCFGMRLNSGRT
jgi:hypothetical protein